MICGIMRRDFSIRLKLIVEQLDLDWDEIKDKLPKPEEDITDVQTKLDSVPTEGEEG